MDSLIDLKQRFAQQLEMSLRQAYGGTLPSLSTIARDLSLRFPYLPHVSTETVRKWLRGVAIPQSPRMQALANWLGDDITQVLNTKPQAMGTMGGWSMRQPSHSGDMSDVTIANKNNHASILNLLDSLSATDYELVVRLAESLASKSAASPMAALSGIPISLAEEPITLKGGIAAPSVDVAPAKPALRSTRRIIRR
ncbi:MAG: hypothetical protein LRY61_01595 [Burkholderiaceae bacterium]|nr:hypothetical protein [Burkholderiaceae bacterium]